MTHHAAFGKRVGVDRVVVVLARDLHSAGREVPNRMVAAVVPEAELERAGTERGTHDLMPEADAEHRHFPEQRAHALLHCRQRRGIARTVRQEHTVGLPREHRGRRRRCRNHVDPAPHGDEVVEDRMLDAEVVGDDDEGRSVGTDGVRLGGRDRLHEVAAVGAAVGLRRRQQRVTIGASECTGHRTRLADVARQTARVDAGDARDPLCLQEPVEVVGGPPVRGPAREIADDDPTAMRCVSLGVVAVDPVVADVRVRERDDLARIRRVREDLLVPRERGVEHHFTRGHSVCGPVTDRDALERRPVGQNQLCFGQPHAFPLSALMRALRLEPSERRRARCGGLCR